LQHRAYTPPDARIVLRVHCEQEPSSRSSITLTGSRDTLGLFRSCIDWQISEKEMATIRHYVLQAIRSLAPLARVVPDPDLISANPAFVSRCEDSFHHMGGMRMSQSPSAGVVDLNLRLHGIQNAYVCSCAVFPTSGFSNPTHTLLALAIRLSEHLS
jgi:choline dehydrogenase-like flavoprotein